MWSITGIIAPDQSQTTTWWVSFLGGRGFVRRRLQSRGSKGDECRYAKQRAEKGGKMRNLLTHCNHQAEASVVAGAQRKSHCLPFRRTKWRAMWLREGNSMLKKTVLQHEIASLSLYSHLSADRMMQSEEGNRSPITVRVKPKAKNKVLIRETATGFFGDMLCSGREMGFDHWE